MNENLQENYLRTAELKAGMQSASDITFSDNSVLHKDEALTSQKIKKIKKDGIEGISVYEPLFDEDETDIDPEDILRDVRHKRDEGSSENGFNIADLAREKAIDASKLISDIGVPTERAIQAAEDVSSVFYEAIQSSDDGCYFTIDQIKSKDSCTFTHCINVAVLAGLIVKNCVEDHVPGWKESDIKDITLAGLLHDLGKRSIPLSILNKPGSLTEEERIIMKAHPLYSYQAVKNSNLSNAIKLGILQHHERFYGGGYPQGARGHKIHPYAQVLIVADVFDALTSDRPYHKALPADKAYEIMLEMNCHFNPFYLHLLFKEYVLYPDGTEVMCSDGITRKVIAQNPGYPTRPVLKNIGKNDIVDLINDRSMNIKIVSEAKQGV